MATPCPRCGAETREDDRFCARCAMPLAAGAASADTPVLSPLRGSLPPQRPASPAEDGSLPWGAIGGIVAVALGLAVIWYINRPYVAFSPSVFHCGEYRSVTIKLPDGTDEILVEMHLGGASGPVLDSDTGSVHDFGERHADGTYRVSTTSSDAWECRQPPGRYGMVIRDPVSGSVMAEAEFTIAD